jgi:aryl-phospho-beta-D-glucosidase BglC (GH1 family)
MKVADTNSQPWISEGGLLGMTAEKIGDNATIAALTAHRESYITDYDFAAMAKAGINHVRLPIGWWTFASPPGAAPELISDACYPEKKFVTVSAPMLETLLRQGQRAGLRFLIDMHAMPCGSSDGTYNGVFPADPVFFSNSTAQALGLAVIKNMMVWYKGLPKDLIADKTVLGFTLLNEPGLGVVQGGGPPPRPGNAGLPNNKPVLAWLKQAVQVFQEAISPCTFGPHPMPGVSDCPLLYMNMHEVRVSDCPLLY